MNQAKCVRGCGFYGSAANDGYCSKCYEKSLSVPFHVKLGANSIFTAFLDKLSPEDFRSSLKKICKASKMDVGELNKKEIACLSVKERKEPSVDQISKVTSLDKEASKKLHSEYCKAVEAHKDVEKKFFVGCPKCAKLDNEGGRCKNCIRVYQMRKLVPVVIKELSGKVAFVYIAADWTTKDLKIFYNTFSGIPVPMMRFISHGKQLQDAHLIKDVGPMELNTYFLVLRLRGS